MKINPKAILAFTLSSIVLSACSQQQTASVTPEPVVQPPKVVKLPAPAPYVDTVVTAPLQPAPMPAVVRPAPIPKPAPVVVAMPKPTVNVPPVKAKGTYRGTVPIDKKLLQQYQQ